MKLRYLLAVVLLAACAPEPPAVGELPELPVVVYAAYRDKAYLPELFKEFTRDTGWPVVVRNGTAAGIVDDVLQDRVVPPADVLLTPSVSGVWRAAEEGQLRPNYSPVIADVLSWLRDPDDFWVALSYRNAVIVYSGEQFSASDLVTYEILAEPKFRRKLCLTTSGLSINRAVLAMMLQKLGARETELVVRSWVANLALPPFASEEELLHALVSGQCLVAIVSSDVAETMPDSKLKVHTPIDFYSDIEGLGITRHARNPEGAAVLVEWLLDEDVQRRHAERLSSFAATGALQGRHNINAVASGEEEARLLAERARYY
ncbi:MAG: extracellular solute-binding protein [Gammaproteobacteria bacterium]|nr:extracellular solute-binding protein [Gammaproteobacteria bacterium]MDH5304846.1 extracellular solute-binding protein [Gammaproteobacteria bacterium]MDH5322448.1 extracellular solute-binding protein [Gammaproteobacteria bacterium]